MRKLSEIVVTKFDSIKSRKHQHITMFDELRNIRNGSYKELVSRCREALAMNDKSLYNIYKSKLPVVAFCGVFENGHKANDLVYYNNLMIIDIDGIDTDINEVKDLLKQDNFILALWISPSGKGLKGLIKTNLEVTQHKAVFNSIKDYFSLHYNIELDKSGNDVCRLCFCAWDSDIYYNPNSKAYDNINNEVKTSTSEIKKPISINKSLTKSAFATEGLNAAKDRALMKRVIKFLRKKDISITFDYSNWVKVALAISYTFSYDVGEKYFLELCELDKNRHDEVGSINLLKYCYNKRRLDIPKTINFASLLFLAKEKGFHL